MLALKKYKGPFKKSKIRGCCIDDIVHQNCEEGGVEVQVVSVYNAKTLPNGVEVPAGYPVNVLVHPDLTSKSFFFILLLKFDSLF